MEKKYWIGPVVLAFVLGIGIVSSGCVSMGDGQGIEAIEDMSELEFSKWKLYLTLGVKIGAERLLSEDLVTESEVELAAVALETVVDQSVVPGTRSVIMPALEEVGLTNSEVQLLLLIVEQELLQREALKWLNPETGLLELSPRTKELLTSVVTALRAATEGEAE